MKSQFFILCDVIFLVRLQEKFDIDHSWLRTLARGWFPVQVAMNMQYRIE